MIRNIILFLAATILLSCNQKDDELVFNKKLSSDWKVISSEKVTNNGAELSRPEFNDNSWYTVEIPSTVLNALVKNDVYNNIYFGNNLEKIPKNQFNVPWWYRKVFKLNKEEGENTRLIFNGINYKANIWFNGNLIASSDTVESPFRIYDIDITDYAVAGNNVLAVEIFPPKRGDLTIGFVDWNPWPPDNNMGIWRDVYLKRSKGVSVKNTFVKTKINLETLAEAFLTITTEVTNHSDEKKSVKLQIETDGINISKEILLQPNESKLVGFTDSEFENLHIKNPRIWWPNNLGSPELYECKVSCYINGELSDEEITRFGIRDIQQYVNKQGHKGFKVNGEKILIKGGGWVDDLTLSDTEEKVEAQVKYVKHMNLNTIRLEGFWGNNQAIYDKADENGILVMVGWSCHWEWEGYCGRPEIEYMSITTPEDINLQSKAYRDQVVWLRNHPSIFLWVYGSDKLPLPQLERKLNQYLEVADPTRPVLASCKYWDFGTEHYNISEISGPTGVKMLGPYGYVTPNYWYLDTTNGGAFGFNTETGPGPQVPPVESIKKMLPEESYWPIDEMWEFHLGRNEFQTLNRYLKAFNARYGKADNLDDFAFRSQISNYEAIRAMFEAFAVNKYKSTGIIQWMLNSAWPEMFWQLYDWYLMPNGAFYGTKVACQPLSLIYNYGDNNIYASNEYNENYKNLKAEINILDINSDILLSEEINFDINATESKKIFDTPEIKNLTGTYFIDLRLRSEDQEISNNFYWLSTKRDVPDFENTQWHYTPYKDYADFSDLKKLKTAELAVVHKFEQKGDKQELTVVVQNVSNALAFFIEFEITGKESSDVVLPVFWDDNYISLLPKEKRTITTIFNTKDLKGEQPVLKYKGVNIK